ncbi:hypothetical protein IAT40_007165 [Kwoniella sp. CBS 6097]
MAGIKTSTRQTKTTKSGLTFPVARLQRYLRQGRYARTIATSAAIFMAGTIEYLIAEIAEMAGNAARDNKTKTIKPRHLKLAIANDEDFSQVIGKATIAQGGVIPYIAPSLLPRKSKAKMKVTQTTTSTATSSRYATPKGLKSITGKKVDKQITPDQDEDEEDEEGQEEEEQEESAAIINSRIRMGNIGNVAQTDLSLLIIPLGPA